MKSQLKIVLLSGLVIISGCKSKSNTSVATNQGPGSESSFKITSRAPLVVKAGDTLSLTGEGFRTGMSLALSGNPIGDVEVTDSANAT